MPCHSSGGPYALACAALLPARVVACAAVSSDPPYAHPRVPAAVRASDDMSADAKGGFYGKDPAAKVARWRASALAGSPKPAKAHAWKQGVLGFVTDFSLERLPWAFRIESIALGSALTVWAGDADYAPIALGAPWMAQLVEGAQLRVVPGGHGFKSEPRHLAAILGELRLRAEAAETRAAAGA